MLLAISQMGDQPEPKMKIEEEVQKVVEQAKEVQEVASSLISKSLKEEKDLQQRALSLDASITKLGRSISSLTRDGQIDSRLAEKVFHQSL